MKPLVDEELLASLSGDTTEGLRSVVAKYMAWRQKYSSWTSLTEEQYQVLLDFFGFLKSLVEVHELSISVPMPTFNQHKDYDAVLSVIGALDSEIKDHDRRETFREAYRGYASAIPGGFVYEFLESDYKRLQELINEIRTLASESKQLDQDHRRRLLSRIERLQMELNKRMSSVDVFWGMLGEAGVALGKFGEDVKPLTDRICEILRIVCRTEARASGLPPGKKVPLLTAVQDIDERGSAPHKE
jgi:hypothetical protein